MNGFLICGLLLLAAVNTTLAAAKAVKGKAPAAPIVAETSDPVEQEYQRLLALDDKVHEEIDQLIRDNAAFKEKGAGVAEAALALKIEQRLEPVRQGWQDFLQLHPKHARGFLAHGSFLNDLGEELDASKQWERARELDPANPAAWNNLANYFGHRGPVKKAFEYYAKAIALDPKQSVYHHNLGTTVFLFRTAAMEFYQINEQQVFDRALAHYAEAMRLAPDDFKLAADVAQTYYGIRPPRHDAAIAAWEQALKLARDDAEREGIHLHLARVQINAGRFEVARKELMLVQHDTLQVTKQRVAQTLETKEKLAQEGAKPAPAPVKP